MGHRTCVVWPLVAFVAAGCANQPPASPSVVGAAPASAAVAAGSLSSGGSGVSRPSAEGGVSASCVGTLAEWQLTAADGSAMGGTCCPAFGTDGKLLRAEFCDIFKATGRFTGATSFQRIQDGGQIDTFRFVAGDAMTVDIAALYQLEGQQFTAEGTISIRRQRVAGRCRLMGADDTSGREHRWIFERATLTQMGQTDGWIAFCPPL